MVGRDQPRVIIITCAVSSLSPRGAVSGRDQPGVTTVSGRYGSTQGRVEATGPRGEINTHT